VNHLAVARNERGHAGQPALVDKAVHGLIDALQALRRHPDRGGFCELHLGLNRQCGEGGGRK
jgi:hypothetical protein